jgi:hypothetical protein
MATGRKPIQKNNNKAAEEQPVEQDQTETEPQVDEEPEEVHDDRLYLVFPGTPEVFRPDEADMAQERAEQIATDGGPGWTATIVRVPDDWTTSTQVAFNQGVMIAPADEILQTVPDDDVDDEQQEDETNG